MIILLIVIFLSTISCLDMVTDKVDNIVGNIECMHTGGTMIKGYSLELSKGGGFYEPIISEDVLELFGNDSVLYVKSFDLRDTNYYKVRHSNGLSVSKVVKILRLDFDSQKIMTFPYKFPPSLARTPSHGEDY